MTISNILFSQKYKCSRTIIIDDPSFQLPSNEIRFTNYVQSYEYYQSSALMSVTYCSYIHVCHGCSKRFFTGPAVGVALTYPPHHTPNYYCNIYLFFKIILFNSYHKEY